MTSIRENPEDQKRAAQKILDRRKEMWYNALNWEVGLAVRLKAQRGDSKWSKEKY